MTTDDSKFYVGNLNKLQDEHSNIYHYFIGKNPSHADYSALSKEIKLSHKSPKFKVSDRVRIVNYKNIFRKDYTKNWSK